MVHFTTVPGLVLPTGGNGRAFACSGTAQFFGQKAIFANISSQFTTLSSEASRMISNRPQPVFEIALNPAKTVELVQEPATGMRFPVEFCLPEQVQDCQALAGMGVRNKKIIIKNIKVYAAGIYLDQPALKAKLGPRYASKTVASVASSPTLYADVLAADDVAKTLRLVMFYNRITGEMISDALCKSLEPALKGEPETMKKFKSYFGSNKLERGTAISFAWRKGGQLTTTIAGKEMGTIASPKLCRTLFSLYLGDDSITPELKENVGKSVAKLVCAK